ncbi:hypothetical protein SLOPH_1219 [Spraguea lophii 42_110]|uniref:t-SNARE coiled-coil homology domain-containing protein n=1 Tax=Spraguea lophii (strain 42_110) TaxID=1358809 RepID=S7XHY1_SPRLO|nr:hypothetical protein SLOPH_1219 [Spraguea lophii 42_110]
MQENLEMEKDENEILRERVKKLRHIALEIKKEADEQTRLMDENRNSFSSVVVKMNNTIDALKTLIDNRFNMTKYIIISAIIIIFALFIFFKLF